MRTRGNPTNSLIAVSAFAILMLFAAPHARGSDVIVIANPSVKTNEIAADELKKVFLLETRSLKDGTHAEPVLRKSGVAHEAFVRDFLNTNDAALQTYYRTLVFTGRASMPKVLSSDAEVVAYVARTKGAIAYVSGAIDTDGVKILAVVSERNHAQRKLMTRVEPKYPETLQQLQIGGTVRLAVTISPQGSVDSVQLLGGNPILAEAAIKAVKQWVYSPSSSPTTTEVSLRFDPQR